MRFFFYSELGAEYMSIMDVEQSILTAFPVLDYELAIQDGSVSSKQGIRRHVAGRMRKAYYP